MSIIFVRVFLSHCVLEYFKGILLLYGYLQQCGCVFSLCFNFKPHALCGLSLTLTAPLWSPMLHSTVCLPLQVTAVLVWTVAGPWIGTVLAEYRRCIGSVWALPCIWIGAILALHWPCPELLHVARRSQGIVQFHNLPTHFLALHPFSLLSHSSLPRYLSPGSKVLLPPWFDRYLHGKAVKINEQLLLWLLLF